MTVYEKKVSVLVTSVLVLASSMMGVVPSGVTIDVGFSSMSHF